MHRKSIEAAEHLKDQENCSSNSDHEDTTSTRTQASDASSSNNNNNAPPQPQPQDKDPQQPHPYPEDPEAFRNNSIACLRAKAQEHSAKLLIRAQQDANANNLQQHHQEAVEAGGGAVF